MAISLTESAADRVREYLDRRGAGVGLRLGVKKTGCSGFAYVINYADDVCPDDVVFEHRAVKIVVDKGSLPLRKLQRLALTAFAAFQARIYTCQFISSPAALAPSAGCGDACFLCDFPG